MLGLTVGGTMFFSGCAGMVGSPVQHSDTNAGTAVLSASPSNVAFSSVGVGATAKQTVTITNSGTASESVTAITASGTAFSVSGITLPYTLEAGSSSTFTAEFTPTAAGATTGTLSIVATSGGSDPTFTVALSGTGTQAHISLSPSSVSFGTVTTGQSNSQPVTISNSGNAALTVASYAVTGSGFSVTGLTTPLTVQPGKTASFNIAFGPTSAGNVTGSISLSSNAPNSPTALALTGTAAAATATLSVSPSSLAFGNIAVDASSSQSVAMKNTGNTSVTIAAVSVTGAGFSDSGVNAGLILSPNQSATLDVVFAPTTAGTVSGSIKIASNAAGSPQSLALSGNGTTSHSVSLAWTASTSSDVVGYNVYRGTVSGTYSKITSSPVANTSYTDSTVQSGQNITYYYVVTTVNSSGTESTDSNQATATIP
ncbi:MAG TPA: choice-of-anchor D domain-containing protein [Candidatus Acidoferrum sp.]|nr:choice-of-anchor D domain-containing protein [Candidatus Acidoferrum sp.]